MADYKIVKAMHNGVEYEFGGGGNPDTYDIDFLLVGGGGGSFYASNSTASLGGDGGHVILCCNVSLAPGYYGVNIGCQGQVGNSGGSGTAGGPSIFGEFCAPGGCPAYYGRGYSWGCGASGNGCLGIQTDISGECLGYGGGGAPGGGGAACDGGGYGGARGCPGGDGARGGGGGGGYHYCPGGRGGCGVFIARYLTSCGYNGIGGCKYTCGDYTIHCFTNDGVLSLTQI